MLYVICNYILTQGKDRLPAMQLIKLVTVQWDGILQNKQILQRYNLPTRKAYL